MLMSYDLWVFIVDLRQFWCFYGLQEDRSVINLHLMHTSYFLFVMFVTLFCYALIKGRTTKIIKVHNNYGEVEYSFCNDTDAFCPYHESEILRIFLENIVMVHTGYENSLNFFGLWKCLGNDSSTILAKWSAYYKMTEVARRSHMMNGKYIGLTGEIHIKIWNTSIKIEDSTVGKDNQMSHIPPHCSS